MRRNEETSQKSLQGEQMSKSKKQPVTLEGNTLQFNQDADYTLRVSENGSVKISVERGPTVVFSASQFAAVTTFDLPEGSKLTIDASALVGREVDGAGALNIKGVSFVEADVAADHKFEPSVNLDTLLSDMIAERGVTETLEALAVNGTQADAFKLVWDHLDDNYSYYNTAVNDAFIDLGIEYAQYLLDGGKPLTDVTVKFTVDGTDPGSAPDRVQSLHDNILGNFDELSITDKFGTAGDDAIFARIQDAGLGELIGDIGDYTDGRPIYSGNEGANPAPTIAFDEAFFGDADDGHGGHGHGHGHGHGGGHGHYAWDLG
jgi:hypothetical protein